MNRIMDFSRFINESKENVNIDKIYDKAGIEIEKIKLTFSGQESAIVTKLVNKFVETYDLLKEAQEAHEGVKEILKDKINSSLTAEDKFVTKIIETAKYAMTFSKYTKARTEETEVVDYKEAIEEMMDIFPDIKDGLKEIIKKHTKIKEIVKKEIAGSIKHTHINLNEGFVQGLKDLVDKLTSMFKSLAKYLGDKTDRIESKLDRINQIMKG